MSGSGPPVLSTAGMRGMHGMPGMQGTPGMPPSYRGIHPMHTTRIHIHHLVSLQFFSTKIALYIVKDEIVNYVGGFSVFL